MPTPVNGTTLDPITANGTTSGSAAPIVRTVQWTAVVVTVSAGNTAIIMPANAEIGDLVEAHGASGFQLFPDSGSTFLDGSAQVFGTSILYRKIAASVWAQIVLQ